MTGEQAPEPLAPDEAEAAPLSPIARQAPALDGIPASDASAATLSPQFSPPSRVRLLPTFRTFDLARFAWVVKAVTFLSITIVTTFAVAGVAFALIGVKPFDGVSSTSYMPGAMVQFGRYGNGDAYLRHGWGAHDSDGRWANQAVSELELPYPLETADRLTMSLRFAIRVDPRTPNADLQILANGTTIFRRTYDHSGTYASGIRINTKNMMPRGRLLITFVLDKGIVPIAGESGDALRLDYLILEPDAADRTRQQPATIRDALQP